MNSELRLKKQIQTFWAKVPANLPISSCWEWQGCRRRPFGYGRHRLLTGDGVQFVVTHRIAYFLHYGVDPGELNVCHKCDNPPCCNPHHLFLGTKADNMLDAWDKGRIFSKGWSAKLTPADVLRMKAKLKKGFPVPEVAREFGVTPGCVFNINKGIRWQRVNA